MYVYPIFSFSDFKYQLFNFINLRNGVDYADIIAKKAEYGYKGPGYSKQLFSFNLIQQKLLVLFILVIEFDFDPKYMKTLNVEKGFYKARSDSNYKVGFICTYYYFSRLNVVFYQVETDTFDWGPIIFLTRVDKDESKKTPAKMPFSKVSIWNICKLKHECWSEGFF